MNEVIQCLLNRRSIRSYTDAPITEEELHTILQCGLYAPNGGNNQVVRLTAITNRKVLAKLDRIAGQEFLKMVPIEGQYMNKAIYKAHKNPSGYTFTFHAPVLIIASAPKGWPNGMADSACALDNMLIAASALGLGGCWVNQLHWLTDNQVMRDFLKTYGIKDTEEIYGSMVIGHPASSPQPAPRKEGRVAIF